MPIKPVSFFVLPAPIHYSVLHLSNPQRFVLDLNNTQLSPQLLQSLTKLTQKSTVISKVRHGKRSPQDVRLVFELTASPQINSFTLKPSGSYGNRLVVDFATDSDTAPAKPIVTVPLKPKTRDIIVVIDAGHGGKDPGAIGPRGTREKNVVLRISRRLKKLIDKETGHESSDDPQRRLLHGSTAAIAKGQTTKRRCIHCHPRRCFPQPTFPVAPLCMLYPNGEPVVKPPAG